MVKKTKQKVYPQSISIELPRSFFGLSHIENIDYCINQIEKYPNQEENPVFGYFLARGPGTIQILNQVLPKKRAERFKKEYQNFRYDTLDDLLNKKEKILNGKYIMRNGLIIDLNPAYSP